MPPKTSFLKIMLTRSIGTVWSQKGTLAVETALWKFLQAHSASCGRGAVNSYAYGKTLTTTVMLASKSQASSTNIFALVHTCFHSLLCFHHFFSSTDGLSFETLFSMYTQLVHVIQFVLPIVRDPNAVYGVDQPKGLLN